jgi:hypothetical protein
MRSVAVYSSIYTRTRDSLCLPPGHYKSVYCNSGICSISSRLHGSGLLVHGQMLTAALPAMFPRIAHPEMHRPVRIETFGARFAHTRGMLVAFSPGSAYAKRSPVEQSVGKIIRISPHVLPCPPAVCSVSSPQPPTPITPHFGTQCLSKAVAGLLEVQLFVCDVFKGQISIHKLRKHQFLQ